MQVKVSDAGMLSHQAQVAVVGVPQGKSEPAGAVAELDAKSGGALTRYLAHGDLVKASRVHVVPVAAGKCVAVMLVTQDHDKDETGSWDLQRRVAAAGHMLAEIKAKSAVIDLASLAGPEAKPAWAARQVAQALAASAYKFGQGTQPVTHGPAQVTLVGKGKETARAAAIGAAVGEGMRVARHLGEQPPNILYPETLAAAAAKYGREAGLSARILKRPELAKLKMGGLLGVGQGSAREPRLLVLRHDGGAKGAKPLVLIGKGITFDTGGNSLKPSAAMLDMKFDMCGAAGVIGTLLACARMKLPLNVAAVVPSAENMVAGHSFRPDDILTMMNGKRVEVLNTDAEGRLILADAITYAQRNLKPAAIVDAATLTGACLVALGQHRAGLCANDNELAAELAAAGEDSADPCWRLPLDDAYDKLLKSKIADFANVGGGRNAGTITAACFLQRFVDKGVAWAHLDIAGTAWQKRRASGRPVPLLATWLARRAGLVKD